jgi:hypothetical protein
VLGRTINERNSLKASKNALSQALKIVKPDVTKPELFNLIDVPACFTTTTR